MAAEKLFYHFSTKTYVVVTRMSYLSMRRFLSSTQNICLKLWVRKYLQFYTDFFGLSEPYHGIYLLPKHKVTH